MKAEGFVLFWMVEHEYCLRWKVINGKSSKGEKLQTKKQASAKKMDNCRF